LDNFTLDVMGTLPFDPDGFIDIVNPRGRFHVECYDKDGNLKWTDDFKNGIVNEGLNRLLNVMFDGTTTRITAWYIGLISNSGYSALAAGDTMASHSGWAETVAYGASNRPQWTAGTTTTKSTTNSSTVDFAINADGTVVKGIFITSDNTKSGTSGVLWSTGLFSADQTLANGDTLKITYTVNAS
jgi:hypothetical protein